MNIVHLLFLVAIATGLFIPAYAQNISNDEVDIMIRELIKECHEKVMADESLTDAEKTVAKRNCETEITNKYKNVEIDHKQFDENKAMLQNIQSCEDWYPQYRFLTEEQFRLQKSEETVTNCILLYNDPIWNYVGDDRLEKLGNRLPEIKDESMENSEPIPVSEDIDIGNLESNILKAQQESNNVENLQEKIRILEDELAKKDQIIKEQLKVIMELVNRIKNVMFVPFSSVFMQS